MKKTRVKGVDISVLSLGTVQLGLNYGINNADGKPNQATANEILDCAMANGINTLDTAGAYGDSEVVIGNWLRGVPQEKRPFIVTKAAQLDHSSIKALRKDLFDRVAVSKKRLGVQQLDILMLHHFDDYMCDKDNVRKVMHELKDAGEVRMIGASAYSFHNYEEIANTGFDATQIPINLFDWGQIDNGGLKKLETSGMMVFVRSVYLQGLVFQTPDTLAPHMEFARETLVKFGGLCQKYHLMPAQLALTFALSLPGVTSLVLGSEKVEQVRQNVELLQNAPQLTKEQLKELHDTFCDTPARVLNPSEWRKN